MLVFTAIPEEWFFRGYLLKRVERGIYGNIIVSVAFVMLHLLSQNYTIALMVFFPSLLYGWVFQKTGSLITVIMLHALSNLLFIVYLRDGLIAVSLS
jgi:membrane protease YdiL (CAAX protease family)